MNTPDFEKSPLIPVVIQHHLTGRVLMVGFMNSDAYRKTVEEKKVTFFSRSKNRLWTKGETSGNCLHVSRVDLDCDADTLLIHAIPDGPTCHTGRDSCFDFESPSHSGFVEYLEHLLQTRKLSPVKDSYTSKLFAKGIDKIAQKVGEEAVETVIASKNEDKTAFIGEASDLLFHLLVLLSAKDCRFEDLLQELHSRHQGR